MYYSAPTYNIDTDIWEETLFETRPAVVKYIDSQFKYPSEYGIKYAYGYWNKPAKTFQEKGQYAKYVHKSRDFKKHWDAEKSKCAFEGFIIYKKPSEGVEFAVPGLYYWYLNYCPIPDKIKGGMNDFAEIYDGDYHYFLYILRCLLHRRYGVVLKKRQSGYTLKNMAIMLNVIWFGKKQIAKIFASDVNKVKDSWKFMETYKDHINTHCGWKRGLSPSQPLDWRIARKPKRSGDALKGNLSEAKGFTTGQDYTNGVGGGAKLIFGEESGINATLDKTHEFITSNVGIGGLTTGLIIYSGAVGELDKAEPLKDFMLRPTKNDFLACHNNIPDDFEFGDSVGFFVPEWWNYVSVERDEEDNPIGEALRCYDSDGNTNKEQALSEIIKWRELAKAKKPESYRYYCSQRPLSIKEAFAIRKDSLFPLNLIEAQKRRISEKEYPAKFVELEFDSAGKIVAKPSNRLPISEFPLPPNVANKEGVIVVWEDPIQNPEFKTYVASVDPVKKGKSSSSESLFSIYIYKMDIEVRRIQEGAELESFIESGKIVAVWTGRFDDIGMTHKRAEILIEWYNAWTLVENNASQFIDYMIYQKKQKYLVPSNQFLFGKDLDVATTLAKEYGWGNYGRVFRDNILPYGIEFLKEHLHRETKPNGEVVRIKYGIERIPDEMLLKEMEQYTDEGNFDRLIAYCALIAFVRIQQANTGYKKVIERVESKNKDPNYDPYKVARHAFNHIGRSTGGNSSTKFPRKPFRNMR